MTPGRNRVRARAEFDGRVSDDLPDAPDNPEFEMFDPAFQDRVAARFERGITRRMLTDAIVARGVTQASRDCAQRFRDAALKRANGTTIGDAIEKQGRDESRRRRERRAGNTRSRS